MTDSVAADDLLDGEPKCVLLGGAFSLLLQMLLGFAALSTLLYKRMLEVPKRNFKVWAYDASKQALGSMLLHTWNMALSMWLAKLRRKMGGDTGDECAMYFVNFTIDIFLGTALIWALVSFQRYLARVLNIRSLRHTGYYGEPPRFRVYFAQVNFHTQKAVLYLAVPLLPSIYTYRSYRDAHCC
jgi:STIMATE family